MSKHTQDIYLDSVILVETTVILKGRYSRHRSITR